MIKLELHVAFQFSEGFVVAVAAAAEVEAEEVAEVDLELLEEVLLLPKILLHPLPSVFGAEAAE